MARGQEQPLCYRMSLVGVALGRSAESRRSSHMWSSQHYIDQGIGLGKDIEVLTHAVDQIERVLNAAPHLPSILSLNHLAKRSQVSYPSLRKYIARDPSAYRHFKIKKRSGGKRLIS